DHDQVLAAAQQRDPIFQKAAMGEPPDQKRDLLVDLAARRRKGRDRKARTQRLRALEGAGAECSEPDPVPVVEAGRDTAVRVRLERHPLVQARGDDGRGGLASTGLETSLFPWRAQRGRARLRYAAGTA